MKPQRVVVMVSIVLCAAVVAQAQTEWEQDPGNPIIGPGDPGKWDEGGRVAFTVLFDGSIFHMWFAGCDASCSEFAIGHATSLDRVSWDMDVGNPVVTRGEPGKWDDAAVFGAAVLYDGSQFHMWYGGSDGSLQQAGYATSPDGSVWTKDALHNPVIEVGPQGTWDDWIIRPGTVISEGATYKMWYMAAAGSGILRIGYAESADGISWDKHPWAVLDMDFTAHAWDRAVGNPWVVLEGSTYHMWYIGLHDDPPEQYRIGYAYGADGVNWTKHRDNPIIVTPDAFTLSCPVVYDGSKYHAWFSHRHPPDLSVSYATSSCCAGVFGSGFETGDTSAWSATVP